MKKTFRLYFALGIAILVIIVAAVFALKHTNKSNSLVYDSLEDAIANGGREGRSVLSVNHTDDTDSVNIHIKASFNNIDMEDRGYTSMEDVEFGYKLLDKDVTIVSQKLELISIGERLTSDKFQNEVYTRKDENLRKSEDHWNIKPPKSWDYVYVEAIKNDNLKNSIQTSSCRVKYTIELKKGDKTWVVTTNAKRA